LGAVGESICPSALMRCDLPAGKDVYCARTTRLPARCQLAARCSDISGTSRWCDLASPCPALRCRSTYGRQRVRPLQRRSILVDAARREVAQARHDSTASASCVAATSSDQAITALRMPRRPEMTLRTRAARSAIDRIPIPPRPSRFPDPGDVSEAWCVACCVPRHWRVGSAARAAGRGEPRCVIPNSLPRARGVAVDRRQAPRRCSQGSTSGVRGPWSVQRSSLRRARPRRARRTTPVRSSMFRLPFAPKTLADREHRAQKTPRGSSRSADHRRTPVDAPRLRLPSWRAHDGHDADGHPECASAPEAAGSPSNRRSNRRCLCLAYLRRG